MGHEGSQKSKKNGKIGPRRAWTYWNFFVSRRWLMMLILALMKWCHNLKIIVLLWLDWKICQVICLFILPYIYCIHDFFCDKAKDEQMTQHLESFLKMNTCILELYFQELQMNKENKMWRVYNNEDFIIKLHLIMVFDVLMKWDHHLIIGIYRTLWNLDDFS